MTVAELIRKMAEAGAPTEAIAIAVEAIEAKDGEIAERRAAERDRKRRQRAAQAERQVRDGRARAGQPEACPGTVAGQDGDKTLPPKERSPGPPKEITPNPGSLRSERQRPTRLPADFLPDLRFAAEKGLSQAQAAVEAAKFRNYWTAKAGADALKLDWQATWRNWVLNALPKGARDARPQASTAFQQRHQSAIEAFDRKLGITRDDDFTGGTLDLEPADWRTLRAVATGH
ncbi:MULTISPECIES: hypothetical protein [unclassified Sinorhizobium]|uniref:hypothetical protein n=1 Tax=unclassified Sinorhizobium TaxID=2613772 RepID=UPI00352359B9